MKTIETQFSKDGYQFTQEQREGIVAVYSKVKKGQSHYSWEVVILKENPPFEMHGVAMGDCESYPRSEKWGEKGFTYQDREAAMAKFCELLPK